MNTITLDPAQVRAFGQRLASSGRRRISLGDLWKHFAESFPARPEGSGAREWLRTALETLAAENLVVLPSQRGLGWDTSSRPAIPRAVRLPSDVRKRDAPWKAFPWHRELAWVGTLSHISEPQRQFLLRVHRGLVEGAFADIVPLKHRSLQLTRSEKHLRHIMTTHLFGPGRLTLEMLRCEEEPTPLAWERVGPGARMIILENSAPFHLVRQVLESTGGTPYGLIGYGGGAGFWRSVGYLATISEQVREIHYVGDIDRPGLTIARGAALRATKLGLPPITAAPGVHAAMLAAAAELGHPDGWLHKDKPYDSSDLVFYPQEVRAAAAALLEQARRIPEEVLTAPRLLDAWRGCDPDESERIARSRSVHGGTRT